MAYEPTPFDQYTLSALQQAQGLMTKPVQEYPQYIPSQTQAPQQYDYYNYTPSTPMQQIAQPNYKSMMEGDYDKLQTALTTPGQSAATSAYNQGMSNLQNVMSGRGLYGSSIMQNQQTQGLDKVYQQALANNASQAAATRYGMQQQDLSDFNKFMAQNFATDVGQQKNLWGANALDAENQNTYNSQKLGFGISQDSALRDWQNKMAYEQYTYDLAKNAYANQGDESLMNRALALAGQGAPLTQMATQYNIAQQQNEAARKAAQDAASSKELQSWLGLGGSIGGGLLGSDQFMNWLF